ncbi:hypothetical protein K227x_03090 [Rubripirellula lacrimiformis]|uniref:Uncharacterized protein n=1 Tax=Rubripirellula lacrimiformis TaxID=1930273 RepID=A0A517N472_9BACT|nr:hypothetical protein K227x_03090 [Rubripirellula lacrimiformis]
MGGPVGAVSFSAQRRTIQKIPQCLEEKLTSLASTLACRVAAMRSRCQVFESGATDTGQRVSAGG